MKKCGSKDCSNGAKFVPKLCVPAMGWAIECHEPLQSIMALEVCESCFNAMKPEHFFGPQLDGLPNNLRKVFSILATGKCDPDFDRAFIERLSINSKMYEGYKRALEKQETKH